MSLSHLKTFDLIGKKESVSDYIALIDPTDTPFTTSVKTESIDATLYQWMEDQLRAVAKNTKLEGADGVDTTRDQPAMRSNGTQILAETFKVSGTSEAVKKYGRDKIAAREMMKTGKLLKMDLEHSCVGTGQTYVVAAEAVAGEFAGVQAQIAAATSTTVTGPISELVVVALHEKLYNAGSDATTLMVKPSDAKIIAGFSASGRTVQVVNGDTKLTNVINVYESAFGTVKVVKNRRIRAADALMYDPKNWKVAVLRNWFTQPLAKTGDAERTQMLGEFGLKHSHQKATGILLGLT